MAKKAIRRRHFGYLARIISLILCMYAYMHSLGRAQDWIYTMRPGDNLWDISEQYLVSMGYWRPLQELNNVATPREMPPGSRLRVPVRWLKVQPASVMVVYVSGEASMTDGLTADTAVVAPGMSLRAGDELRTGADSSATLQFADGSLFLVQQNTRLAFDLVSAYGTTGMVDTRLRLHEGRLDARTAPSQGAGTRFEVWTPAAVSSVRGTEYRIGMDAGRETALAEVLQGAVEVTGGARTQRVPEGFGTTAEVGEPPSPPVPLLPPPDLSGLPGVLDRVPLQIELPPLAGAAAYRLQVAADTSFEALVFDRVFSQPQLVGPDLPDGAYALRVRAIDEQGLEGKDAIQEFVLDARPQPPLLMTPDDDATTREATPEFRWTEPQEARAFHFELVAEDPSKALIDEPEMTDAAFALDSALEPGDYRWRVATIDQSGEEGPFSDPQRFTFRPPPESPGLEDTTIEKDQTVFRWQAGASGQRYQVQLARDRAFESVVIDEVVDQPRLALTRPVPDRYYLRVRTIDVDGFAGSYGSPQKVDVPPESYWPLLIVPASLLLLLL